MFQLVFFITGLKTGGAELMLYKLLSRLDSRRFCSAVISLSDKGELGNRFEDLQIPVYSMGMKPGRSNFYSLWKMVNAFQELKPDIVQGWMYHGNLAAQFGSACVSKKPAVLWNIRQSLYSLKYEKWGTAAIIRAGSLLSRFPKRIIYNSKLSAEQHEAMGYQKDRRVLIPNGFDTNCFKPAPENNRALREELKIPEDSLIIGLMGRYHPMKDHGNFFRAATLLRAKYPSLHFLLAGRQVNSGNETLRRSIGGFNPLHQIHLLGERHDMPRIMAALDICVSSSKFGEGFSNAIGEAMACGVPCVVTDVGDSAWVVGDTGRVVPAANSGALANGLAELVQMGMERRRALGQRARQRVIDNFSLENVVRRYEQLYLEVLGKDI
jgi:glycosyltransferase involved in cell wall biosynthesis